jgi:serpin B
MRGEETFVKPFASNRQKNREKEVCALKRILAAALTFFVFAAPAARASEIDLLKELYHARGQTIVSPVSLNLALLMAAEGAKGETRAQLLAAAGLTEADVETYAPQALSLITSGVAVANAAFIKDGLPVLESYDKLLRDRYQAERYSLGEADVNEVVNAWVKEKTDGLIDTLLDQPPDPNLEMMLVNALSLKADWSDPFLAENTYQEAFHAPDGDLDVDFMHKTENMAYFDADGFRAVRLTYEGSALGLTIVLPDGSVADALDKIAALSPDWDEGATARVALSLPKLSAKDSLSLVDALKALGVTDAFSDAADFSGIDGKQDLLISSVLQKTRLDIDEEGTTAAAATSIGISAKSAPLTEQPVEFTVDKPYILLLTDSATGLTLFAAAIDKP